MKETSHRTSFAFYGSDEFSVKVLEKLAEADLRPALIITNPDRPKGRDLLVGPTRVKAYATEKGIPVSTPASLKDSSIHPQLEADFAVVASYGQIVPKDLIEKYKHGMLNVHPSLLPKYRGATPLQSFILSGEAETGVTIMLMDEEMDHGPILDQVKISPNRPTYLALRDQLAVEGGKLLSSVIPRYLGGDLKPLAQKDDQATYTKLLKKEMGEIKLTDPAFINDQKYRAFLGNIGTFFQIEKKGQILRVKIEEAKLEEGVFVITKVIPAGKKTQTWQEFETNFLK